MRTWQKSSVTTQRIQPRLLSSQRSLTSQRPIPQAMTRAAERGAATSSTVSRVFLDTSLLAYQFDGSEPVKQRVAQSVVTTREHSFVVSTQVLLECFTVLHPQTPSRPSPRCRRRRGQGAEPSASGLC